jgi:hypothetical protein
VNSVSMMTAAAMLSSSGMFSDVEGCENWIEVFQPLRHTSKASARYRASPYSRSGAENARYDFGGAETTVTHEPSAEDTSFPFPLSVSGG